ncbi:putative pseudouridine-5'-monophosphatase [Tritrichomonas foetus]|uniref:Pseudouridine-5'-monophosphatase n=1 Tax=Tritrichomonas foetus TaxID=1144522 RepID=A0A1J4JCF7_9EUKA|nr:putative pseudouridine-5'-monophosphatase [Tritrichomonas foetus]|eukprot:OHS95943.1 putative pseudouridine-5'-monophosphatase [Tritrichomonas foetus]
MSIWPTKIKACIFDNDGTLVDSGAAYSEAHFLTTGQKQTIEIKLKLSGKTLLEGSAITVKECNLDETPEHYAKRFEEVLESLLPNMKLMPGVMNFLNELKKRNIKMCIATGATDNSFRRKVENHQEMIGMMDHIVTGDHVKRGKPAPDLFLKALHKWEGIKPEEALVFEDAPNGVKAANNAGIPVIFIPSEKVDVEKVLKEYDAHPLMTIESLDKFDFSQFIW